MLSAAEREGLRSAIDSAVRERLQRPTRAVSPELFHAFDGDREEAGQVWRRRGERVPRRPCPYCGRPVKRPDRKYCDQECYAAAVRSPKPKP